MKVLVFSDSHGNTRLMQQAVEGERPELVLHLGDVASDAYKLAADNPGLRIETVCGNCDPYGAAPEERELPLQGHKVWMLHGHRYRVKMGLWMLTEAARERGVEVVLFGHTHRPLVDCQGGLWLMNPGTIRGFGQATYGIMELERDKLDCRIGVAGAG